ncbi:hypothetical protein KFE25_000286 [Diacronema lutheri]|uniref:AAA+ ATPase domain-containing protein n=1 Tax=Diacronema lutheri TaxID=2081491 RepID=A0A8J5XCK2_DIALT|nr:hypothetical protein KFE25_000286 [Diacronema lutheri]
MAACALAPQTCEERASALLDELLALPCYAHLRDIVPPSLPPQHLPPDASHGVRAPDHFTPAGAAASNGRLGDECAAEIADGDARAHARPPFGCGFAPPAPPPHRPPNHQHALGGAADLARGARGMHGSGEGDRARRDDGERAVALHSRPLLSAVEGDEPPSAAGAGRFMTAHDKMVADGAAKRGGGARGGGYGGAQLDAGHGARGGAGRSLGVKRARGVNAGFVSPFAREGGGSPGDRGGGGGGGGGLAPDRSRGGGDGADGEGESEYKGVEKRMADMILNEVLDKSPGVRWGDVAGLDFAKQSVMEAVVWPIQRPDLFTGLRQPSKGLLLFGPPGTGKTLIGKAIATESGATFFSISASSLMSKWIGEAEKMVRALFTVARGHLPAVIFVDEIDSLLCQRSEGDQDSTRRVKTEFLVQLDGAATDPRDRLLLIGATNRPQELDEAARRRMQKRLYIPLPDAAARRTMMANWLTGLPISMSAAEYDDVVARTDGYSGSDMHALCREAAMGPMRDPGCDIRVMSSDAVRPIELRDFELAVCQVRASVAADQLGALVEWDKQYGSFSGAARARDEYGGLPMACAVAMTGTPST